MKGKVNDTDEWASKVLRGLWNQTQYAIQLSSCKSHLRRMCIYLTFMGPCITNVFSSITKKMQRYTIYLFL